MRTYVVNSDAEITLEANPDDISAVNLDEWAQMGINRLSIGVQSFFDDDLKWMNRAHTGNQALNCIGLAQHGGFNNLTIDLIYGTPTLPDENWKKNVEMAVSLQIPHLSCYALTVEPKTALDKLIQDKKVADVDPDKQARHFELLMQWLKVAGYEQYEISNFAKPAFRSKHNSSYWQGKPYIGFGPSAHSFNGSSRQWNIANTPLYIQSLSKGTIPFEDEILTRDQQLNEYIMTSLRTIEGLSLEKVMREYGAEKRQTLLNTARRHLQQESVVVENDFLRTTPRGRFLADGIASDLFIL
jgi:oxygen-independent coproporphyrinogen-3 oxidase